MDVPEDPLIGRRARSAPGACRRATLAACTSLLFASHPGLAAASVIAAHQGSSNPLSENFGLWPDNGTISSGGIASDEGLPAWQIGNSGSSNEQASYNLLGGTGPFDSGGSGLTAAQITAIETNGFTLTLEARIISGPTYQSGSTQFAAGASVAGFSGKRFDIDLVGDGTGDTLVVLPTATSFNNAQFTVTPFTGTPLTVSGTGYHVYQLIYDPALAQATLYIDGALQLSGYAGSTVSGGATANNYGLDFGAFDDGTANFTHVELDSGMLTPSAPTNGPLPAWAIGALAASLAAMGALRLRRRQSAVS